MKNLLYIGLGIVGLGIIIGLVRSNLAGSPFINASPSPSASSADTVNTSLKSTFDAEKKQTVVGSYIDYSETAVSTTSGTKILFFHASWCPQCRALDTSIKTGTIPSGVTIIKTDYDTNQELRKKYGVTIQTTLVKIAADGSLIKKYTAYDTPTLQAVKDNLL